MCPDMEHFIPLHRQQAEEKLKLLRTSLPVQSVDTQQKVERGYFSIQQAMDLGFRCMKGNLPMAAIVWETLLPRVNHKEERTVVLNQLFQARLAVGPWTSALETARMLFGELQVWKATEDSIGCPVTQTWLFQAQLNLGTAYRLLKDLDKAESHYCEALCVAQSLQDFDCEAAAKVHLAMCLLDRGQLKVAIDDYFKPLFSIKDKMKLFTRTLYLQYYGNASRSAADWGPAKVYLREALNLAIQLGEPGLLSTCCGDLGNVFRSEGRYKDAELCHVKHYNVARRRGDLHGLAVASGNIGFLKYYDPAEYETSVILQAIEYSLAEEVGDFARMGVACNKIGKLYTTLGHCEEAVKLFRVAIEGAKRAHNIAGEGMAWGNLGTVYRILGRLDEAIKCHLIYRENASKRLDIGGVAIMQHQIAMDFFLKADLLEAERAILDCFQTLEKIRSQIGDEDESKISNFEKNQAEAHNLLQVVLTAQGKYKEAFVLSDRSRTRALSEIVQKRLSCFKTESEKTENLSMGPNPGSDFGHGRSLELNTANVEEYFRKAVLVSQKLATTLVTYSLVKEFDVKGVSEEWVYMWVLTPSGDLHFTKSRLEATLATKVDISKDCIFSLRGGYGGNSQVQSALRSIQFKEVSVFGGTKGPLLNAQNVDELERIEDLLNSCSEDGALTDLSIESKELKDVQDLQDHREMASKSDVCDLADGQEKTTGESFSCKEPCDAPFDLHVEFSNEQDSPDQEHYCKEKFLIEQGTEARSQHKEQSIILEECSSKNVTLQECLVAEKPVLSPQPADPFPREDTSFGPENSTFQKPIMLSNPNVQINNKEEFIPGEDLTSPASVSSSCLDFDVSLKNKCGDYEEPSPEKPCEMPNPNVHQQCEGHSVNHEHSPVPEPIGSPFLSVHSQCEGNSIDQKHSATAPEPIGLPSPGVDSPCEGKFGNQEHSSVPEPVGSPSQGVHSLCEEKSKIQEESVEMPLYPSQTDEVSEEGLSDETNHEPHSLSSQGLAVLSEVAFKVEKNCPSKETCQSGTQFQNAAKETVNTKDSGPGNWKPLLNSAYRVLIEPIKDLLSSDHADSSRVTFIPQDFLLRVPFAALCEGSGNSYLVENFVISTSPSIHLLDLTVDYLSNLQEGSAPEDLSLLAIGNPLMPYKEFASLPAAAQEARMIAEILNCPRNEIALGSRATKNHVTSAMPNFQVLHFATHAVVDVSDSHGDFTHRGFIVLAKSDEQCSGLLMAEEVKQMSLRAELVVLSCCDSGLGKVTGEGILGLSRAFIAAGAACVVVTLWKIDDDCTSQLMKYFYQEYKNSRNAALALHKAMRTLRRSESTQSPEQWAAFAIIGATGQIYCTV